MPTSPRTAVRRLWLTLLAAALVWGFATGISFARDSWLDPASALFGMFGMVVLGLTLNQLSKRDGA